MLKTTLDNGPRKKWLASKATLMMEDHVSGHGTTLSVSGSPDHTRAASWNEEKEREKESKKVFPKEAEEHWLAKNKHKILKCGQKRTLLGGPKDAKARKACQKAMMAFRRVVFTLTSQRKAQARIVPRTKAREGSQRGKCMEERSSVSIPTFSLWNPEEEGCSLAWESDDWSCRQWLDGSWTPVAGWYSTKAHIAWMAVPSLNLAYHPTRVSRSGLQTIDWIEISNWEITETFLVLWYNDRILPLQQILCVRRLRNRSLFGKLHYSLSDNTTTFNHGWCAWDRWCTNLVFASSDEKIWARLLNWILKETRLHAQLLDFFLLQLIIPQWVILCWTWRVLRISLRLNQVIDLVTQRDM